MPVLCAVASMAVSNSRRTGAGSSSTRPMHENRIPLRSRSGSSRLRYRRSNRHNMSTSARARFYGIADRIHASLVSRHARQVTAPRPAAIAVHDDRDVRRQAQRINGVGKDGILTAGLEILEQILYGMRRHRAKLLWYNGSAARFALLYGNRRASLRLDAADGDGHRHFAGGRAGWYSHIELIEPADGPRRKPGIKNVGRCELGGADR